MTTISVTLALLMGTFTFALPIFRSNPTTSNATKFTTLFDTNIFKSTASADSVLTTPTPFQAEDTALTEANEAIASKDAVTSTGVKPTTLFNAHIFGVEKEAEPKPTPALNAPSKPTASMAVYYGASHYAPQDYTEGGVVKRRCESFDEKQLAWIGSHSELASVLEQCENGELYKLPNPEDEHVGGCNKWSIGC
ncbi:hypothetical protein DPSP01_007547 [Paraphaeosphaeria sporulosa]